jgi:hypothetical protein
MFPSPIRCQGRRTRTAVATDTSAPTRQNAYHAPCPVGPAVRAQHDRVVHDRHADPVDDVVLPAVEVGQHLVAVGVRADDRRRLVERRPEQRRPGPLSTRIDAVEPLNAAVFRSVFIRVMLPIHTGRAPGAATGPAAPPASAYTDAASGPDAAVPAAPAVGRAAGDDPERLAGAGADRERRLLEPVLRVREELRDLLRDVRVAEDLRTSRTGTRRPSAG